MLCVWVVLSGSWRKTTALDDTVFFVVVLLITFFPPSLYDILCSILLPLLFGGQESFFVGFGLLFCLYLYLLLDFDVQWSESIGHLQLFIIWKKSFTTVVTYGTILLLYYFIPLEFYDLSPFLSHSLTHKTLTKWIHFLYNTHTHSQ